jgi:hypothetical protein
MRQLLTDHLSATLAAGPGATSATASSAAGYLVRVVLSGLVGLVAVIRILRQSAEYWSHRNWSKLAWVLAILYMAPHLGGYPIPVGATAAIWRTRRSPTGPQVPGQVPMADCSSDWPWPWEHK